MQPLDDGVIRRLQQVLETPETIGERYRIEKRLGAGSMGSVHLARDLRLDRKVAVKVLAIDVSPALGERLEKEALTVARLEHAGVCPIHDLGRLDDGRVYYVMRFIEGETLDRAAAPLPQNDRIRLFLRVLETLGFAHERGVVHRDVKPGNVMVGAFGDVVLVDWGIAKAVRGPEDFPVISGGSGVGTRHGAVLGTPDFMAPEQTAGEAVDARTDVYGAGKTLAAILADAGAADRRLGAILDRATARAPDDRYATAEAFARDLTRWLDRLRVEAYRENLVERAWRAAAEHRFLLWLIVGYLVLRAAVFFFARI